MSNNLKDIQDLFGNAQAQGLDSNASVILVDNLDSVALAGCAGVDIDDLNTDDVTLVAAVLDASSSMSGVRRDVVEGFNLMLEAFRGSKQSDAILLSTWSFANQPRLHFSYTPVELVQNLTLNDYQTDGATALYDTLLYVMTGMVAYGQTLRNNGVRTRCIVVVFSDGDDNTSRSSDQQVRTVSQSLLAQEIYTLAYAGFGASGLQQVADRLGFPAVITASSTSSEIRRIFKQVSTSIIRPGQATNSFFVF